MHILCSTSIHLNDVGIANNLLLSFVDEFEELYGTENMVYNVHQLRHLADCVELNGPLFAYSNYSTEDNIGHTVSFVKGTTDVTKQICSKYLIEKNLYMHLEKSAKARAFYKEIVSQLRFKFTEVFDNVMVIGKPRKETFLRTHEINVIKSAVGIEDESVIQEYNSMMTDGKLFFETSYNANGKRTNDSFIYNTRTGKFCEIRSIFVVRQNVFLLVNENFAALDVSRKYCTFLERTHEYEQKVIEPELIGEKNILVEFESISACSPFPNLFERN